MAVGSRKTKRPIYFSVGSGKTDKADFKVDSSWSPGRSRNKFGAIKLSYCQNYSIIIRNMKNKAK